MGKRVTGRLSAVAVNAKKVPGYYADGNGLYLQVSGSGSKSWLLRYTLNKKAREMGLGALSALPLARAREQATAYRLLLKEGIDPIAYRAKIRAQNLEATAQRRTFEQCTREYYRLHAGTWKSAKHTAQWMTTLEEYAFPVCGHKDVSDVGKADILLILDPIWHTKTETASRVKQRVFLVLDWAAARGYRAGHDPQLKAHVELSLPKARTVKKVKHFAACPYQRVNEAIASIRQSTAGNTVKLAAEFIILNASRSGEVRFAKWPEIDFQAERWIIPAERMKLAREHRVPLSNRSKQILAELWQSSDQEGLIFQSDRGKAFSDMTFTQLLRRLGFDFTMHGFRSTFRDWCAEQTAFPREICEAALAHKVGDDTEAAYFRSDVFEKRRLLMEAWADYCETKRTAAPVIGIGTARTA